MRLTLAPGLGRGSGFDAEARRAEKNAENSRQKEEGARRQRRQVAFGPVRLWLGAALFPAHGGAGADGGGGGGGKGTWDGGGGRSGQGEKCHGERVGAHDSFLMPKRDEGLR